MRYEGKISRRDLGGENEGTTFLRCISCLLSSRDGVFWRRGRNYGNIGSLYK